MDASYTSIQQHPTQSGFFEPRERGLSGYRYLTGEVTGAGIHKISHDRLHSYGVVMYRTPLKPRESATSGFQKYQ
jgi:hypothetical protein